MKLTITTDDKTSQCEISDIDVKDVSERLIKNTGAPLSLITEDGGLVIIGPAVLASSTIVISK